MGIKDFFTKDAVPAVCTDEWCVMFTILTIIFALIFACIEIELEGPCGWADKLPTPATGSNAKSLTIYHYLIFILMFFVFSSIFFIKPRSFNIGNLAFVFAYVLMFFTMEDFYWFVLNPFYKMDGTNIKTGKKAWWHYKLGPVPALYMAGPLMAFGLCLLAGYTKTFGSSSLIFAIATGLVALVSPLYHKFYLAQHPNSENIKCEKQ